MFFSLISQQKDVVGTQKNCPLVKHPNQMLKLMEKTFFTDLRSNYLLFLTYDLLKEIYAVIIYSFSKNQ